MTSYKDSFTIAPNLIVTVKGLDAQSNLSSYKWIPIENSAYFYLSKRYSEDSFFLPKLYAALTFLTGPGDDVYDDFKGSYSFRFELEVQKKGVISHYFYRLYHYRSYVQFSVYHRVSKSDPRDSRVICKPDDELFSGDDIRAFSCFFGEHALESMEKAQYKPESFVKGSASNLLLFGFLKGEYFFESFRDCDQYEEEKKRKEASI